MKITYGPITHEQHEMIARLPENYVRRTGYCWLVFWVPGHGLHPTNCA